MKFISLIMLISVTQAFAAPVRTATPTKKPMTAPVSKAAPVTTAAAPAADPKRSPWRLIYNLEYYGPRFSNFDLSRTQAPDTAKGPSETIYTNLSHTVKISYAITDEFIIGGSLRMQTLLDPNVSSFAWKNNRLFFTWANMIDTAHVSMGTTVDFELPTSQGARAADAQQILAINLKNTWGFKIPATNWSFGAMTLIRNTYSNLPNGQSLSLGLFPEIEYTVSPNFSFVSSGSFDASNSYKDIFWSYAEDDPDYVAVGLKYSPISNWELHPAAQFFTADFNVPTLYFETSVVF